MKSTHFIPTVMRWWWWWWCPLTPKTEETEAPMNSSMVETENIMAGDDDDGAAPLPLIIEAEEREDSYYPLVNLFRRTSRLDGEVAKVVRVLSKAQTVRLRSDRT